MYFVKLALAGLALLGAGAVGFVYSMPEKATGAVLAVRRHRAGLVRKEMDLPGGLHYVYLEGGRGEPLMLLHGFGADKYSFTPVARFLTQHYHVIVPDHIGFGESARPPAADYAPTAQVERLRAFARALGIPRLHLGGHSMGGHIALTYAALYPAEVESLWLLDTAGVWSVPQRELDEQTRKTGHNPLLVKRAKDLKDTLAFSMTHPRPPFIPGPILEVLARPRVENAPLEERILDRLKADPVEGRIVGLAQPTLIVWGTADRVIDVESATVLNRLLPRSQVIRMPGIGHMPMMERPRQSTEDYLEFRTRLQEAAKKSTGMPALEPK